MDIFFGIVEDINDPKKLGRVKVRLINEHSDKVLPEDIPWAIPMMPVTSASYLGIGSSPVGIQIGSRVIIFYLDGKHKTKPVIMGTYPIILGGNEADHSVTSHARGNGAVEKDYLDYEPRSQYASQYPYNQTNTTKSGHVIEIDDTPKAERIHTYHKSGSYTEMNPDGSVVNKAVSSSTDICLKDKNIISDDGNINILSNNGQNNLISNKDTNISSNDSTVTVSSKDDLSLLSTDSSINIAAKKEVNIATDNGSIMISTDAGDIIIKAKHIKLTGIVTVNGKVI